MHMLKRKCLFFLQAIIMHLCFLLLQSCFHSRSFIFAHALTCIHISSHKKACTHKENLEMNMHGHMTEHRNHHEWWHINYLSLKEKRAEPARDKGECWDSRRRNERKLFNYAIGVTAYRTKENFLNEQSSLKAKGRRDGEAGGEKRDRRAVVLPWG